MNWPRTIGNLLLTAFLTNASLASEEDIVPWKSVRIECGNLGEAGSTYIDIRSNNHGIETFLVSSFGKTFTLSPEAIKKIHPFPLTDLRITHEQGYKITGGSVIHVKLFREFHGPSKGLREKEQATISFQRNQAPIITVKSIN